MKLQQYGSTTVITPNELMLYEKSNNFKIRT